MCVLVNEGAGVFRSVVVSADVQEVYGLYVADVDSDGSLDILASTWNDMKVCGCVACGAYITVSRCRTRIHFLAK